MQSEEFVEAHGERPVNIGSSDEESNSTKRLVGDYCDPDLVGLETVLEIFHFYAPQRIRPSIALSLANATN